MSVDLIRHQLFAFAWLTAIEAGGVRDGHPSLWEPLSGPGPTNEYISLCHCHAVHILIFATKLSS